MANRLFLPAAVIILLLIVDSFLFRELPFEKFDGKFPTFRAVNLNGDAVTEDIFDGKITVLCVWTAKGGHCAELLESLDAMNKNLPPRLQIIGLIGDLNDTAAAESIAKKYSPTIPQILANDDFMSFLSKVRAVPTTIFVDAQGNLIGQPVIGAEPKLIQLEISHLLEGNSPRLEALRKIQASIFL